jgi:acyl-CoA synthetase (NDP forming)
VLAATAEEAVAAAADLGGRVVLKIVSPQIMHKSEAGGVRLDIESPDEISRAFDEIVENARKHKPGAAVRGVLVTPMAAGGIEVIVGTKIDDQFGPVIMFGIGGIAVEVLKDVAFRVLPITPRSAKRMIEDIRSVRLLNGFRGRPPADREAISKLLLCVSEIVESYPDIREMDLNPVIVFEKGLVAVDARIVLKGM